MDYLSTVYLPGALALWVALAFALASLWGYAQTMRGDEGSRLFARRSYRFFTVAIVLASAVLAIALATRDYRIDYVHQYSGNELPMHFQIAAFWAGQKGSFLIWLFFGALIGLPLLRSAGKEEAPVMAVYLLTQLGLLLILVRENPFLMLRESPHDGQGLNPLLQDPWMVIHPPIMFVGYALTAVPFSFVIAALLRRQYESWAIRAFPWALAGFLVLGTAILLGGYWAYKTLGWGGYWGWDPVENASLIPWLLGAALIHSLYLERMRGRYRRANMVLAILVYLAVLYGTFLTRSGVLADFSVHSFVDLGISGWLIALMAFFFGGSGYLLAIRLREVPSPAAEDRFLTKTTFLVLATIALLASALVVTLGTSAPLITRFMENPGQVGPEFYNRVNLPVALLVAFLLGVVPYLSWRGVASWRDLLPRMIWPLAATAVTTVAAAVVAVRDPFHLAFVFLATLALAANLEHAIRLGRSGGLRSIGGYLSHIGVGVILLGILASSAYDESAKVTLEEGRSLAVQDLTLTFKGYQARTASERERMVVEVEKANGTRYTAYPRMHVNDRTQQLMANPHIRNFALMDLYISPLEYNPGEPGGPHAHVRLVKDQEVIKGDLTVRFLGFDLSQANHAATDQPVSVGAVLEVRRAGQTQQLTPLFRFSADGRSEFPPVDLPGGGRVSLAAIDAASGAIDLLFDGLPGVTPIPARLSVDVTRKPLIQLVWIGLYIIFAGGALSAWQRFGEALRFDAAEAANR